MSTLSMPDQGGQFPPVEIRETAYTLQIIAELPGYSQQDLEVLLQDTVLLLRGSRSSTPECSVLVSERRAGVFERAITLPVPVIDRDADLTLDRGLLCVTLLKRLPATVGAEFADSRLY